MPIDKCAPWHDSSCIFHESIKIGPTKIGHIVYKEVN